MPKMSAIDVMQWAQAWATLVSIGATTYTTIKRCAEDAGWPEDDARLAALDIEYAARIERAKAAAAGGG